MLLLGSVENSQSEYANHMLDLYNIMHGNHILL